MDLNEANRLLDKYLSGQCTKEEAVRVEQWLDRLEKPDNGWANSHPSERAERIAQGRKRVEASLFREQPMHGKRLRKRIILQWAAALILFIMLPAAGYFLVMNNAKLPGNLENSVSSQNKDLNPGTDKAVLTLSDGSTMVLDHTTSGKLATQGNTHIRLVDSGRVVYTAADTNPAKVVYNTIATPKGGQFQVVLPDNTHVWLNAVSSIRFPTVFGNSARTVQITGEVYFEVAEDKNRPFLVTAGTQVVNVLGTHFNVNSYPDENGIKTTLLEGSVQVSSEENSVLLKPGQQSVLKPSTSSFLVNTVETESVIAWKNGFFQIENADIQTIMRQVARWYDVDIVYEGPVPDKRFSGKIRRDVNASQLLEMLTYFGVQFQIDDNQITVIN